jgi:hypothetical protein
VSRALEVVETFVEAAALGGRKDALLRAGAEGQGDPEPMRAIYRDRHRARGLCVSCPRPVKPGRDYCADHLRKANARAMRSKRAHATSPEVRSAIFALRAGGWTQKAIAAELKVSQTHVCRELRGAR